MIDAHVHLGKNSYYLIDKVEFGDIVPTDLIYEDLKRTMKKNKVERAVVFPFPSSSEIVLKGLKNGKTELFALRTYYEFANNYILSASNEDKSLIPFLSVIPNKEESLSYLEKRLKEENVYGLKFHGPRDRLPISSLEEPRLIDMIRENDLSLTVHTWHPDYKDKEYEDPMELVEIAKRHPEIRIAAAHFGMFSQRFVDEAAKLRNFFFDCSPLSYLCSLEDKAIDKIEADYENPNSVLKKLLEISPYNVTWGSDAPFCSLNNGSYEKEKGVLDGLTEEEIYRVTEENTMRFLGL
ncbi:MAG: amidohydrolase family protein [Candidatus Aenigmatarchaeota archaeon]